MVQPRHARTRAALIIGLTLTGLIAGCSGAPATSPASGSPSPAPATVTPVASPSAAPSLPAPSPSSTPAPSATATAGESSAEPRTGRIEVAAEGFAITLSKGWGSIPLSESDVAAFLKVLPPDSELGQLVSGQAEQLIQSGVKLWAFDLSATSRKSGFASNLNVIVQPDPGLSLDVVGSMNAGVLQNLSSIRGTVKKDSIDLPAGPAVRVTYELSQQIADGRTVDVAGNQFYLIANGRLYILTFGTSAADAKTRARVFNEMARSFELLD